MFKTIVSLRQTTAVGMTWLLLQNVGGRVISFLSQLIVASQLFPHDFGLIGLTYTVSTIGAMLVNFGIEPVLLQRHRNVHFWIVPAFWFTFGLSLIGCILVVLISPLAARIYDAPGLPVLAGIVGSSMPLTALGTVPTVMLKAQFQFKLLATIGFLEIVGTQGLMILLAWLHFGAFSLVIPLPIVAACKTAGLWYWGRPNMRGGLAKVRRVKYLMGNSTAVFLTSVIHSVISQGDYVVLGVLGTESAVGDYFFAFKMASQPLLLMALSLSSVLFPTLSGLRHSPQAQGEAACKAAKMLGLIIMPIAFLQAAIVGPAIHIFFKSKWDASIPLMQILSVGLGFDAIAWIAGTLLTVQRGFRQQFFYVTMCALLFFVLVVIGGLNGSAMGVAIGVAVYYIFVSPLYSYIVFRRCSMTVMRLAWLYLMPACMAAFAIGGGMAAATAFRAYGNLGQVGVTTLVSGPLYMALFRFIDPSSFKDAVSIIRLPYWRR